MPGGGQFLVFPGLLAAAPDADAVRRKAAEVFARPEFDPTPRKYNWLEWIEQFFKWLGGLSGTSPTLFWIMLIGCIVLLVLLLGHIIYTLYRAVTVTGATAGREGRAARLRESAEHFAAAQHAAASGQFTEAIRELFLALVFRYDEAGRVTLCRSATNREYLGLLPARLPVRGELQVFVDTLDDYWYAQRAAERQRYDTCLSLYHRLASQ